MTKIIFWSSFILLAIAGALIFIGDMKQMKEREESACSLEVVQCKGEPEPMMEMTTGECDHATCD